MLYEFIHFKSVIILSKILIKFLLNVKQIGYRQRSLVSEVMQT